MIRENFFHLLNLSEQQTASKSEVLTQTKSSLWPHAWFVSFYVNMIQTSKQLLRLKAFVQLEWIKPVILTVHNLGSSNDSEGSFLPSSQAIGTDTGRQSAPGCVTALKCLLWGTWTRHSAFGSAFAAGPCETAYFLRIICWYLHSEFR